MEEEKADVRSVSPRKSPCRDRGCEPGMKDGWDCRLSRSMPRPAAVAAVTHSGMLPVRGNVSGKSNGEEDVKVYAG